LITSAVGEDVVPDANVWMTLLAKGNAGIRNFANGAEQFRVSPTASAVNYVQVTGAATGGAPAITSQGSDANIGLSFSTKGAFNTSFRSGNGSWVQFVVNGANNSVNYLSAAGSVASSSPVLSSVGSDTNIDLNLTTKGTGVVNLNTGSGRVFSATDHPFTGGGSNVNYTRVFGGQTGYSTGFVATGSDANIVLAQSTKGTSPLLFLTNNFAQEQFRVSHTASAVNYVQVTGGATGNSPSISWQGSDANIQAAYLSKGTGVHSFFSGLGARKLLQLSDVASSVNFLEVIPSATGVGVRLIANGSDTNIPLVLQPKGTGALQAQQTDSTATGGNARGANAVDWQTSRDTAARVASGSFSIVGGGSGSSATTSYSSVLSGLGNTSSGVVNVIAGGFGNIGSGNYSTIVGGGSNTSAGWYNFIGGGSTNAGTANGTVTTQSGTMNGTTAVTLSGSNANIKVGQYITGTSISGDTYVSAISGTSLTLSKVASGSSTSTLSFYTPHGVVVGGGNNQATGSYSFIGGGGDAGTAANRNVASGDWSTVGGGFKNTASGLYSTVVGGYINTANNHGTFVGGGGYLAGSSYPNTASGQSSSVVGGLSNTASGNASSVIGGYSGSASGTYSAVLGGSFGTTRAIAGMLAFSACQNPISQSTGLNQSALLILARQTTDATATVLTSDTSAAGTTNQVILPNNSAYTFRGEIVSGVTGGGNSKSWTIEGLIKRGANAASTTLVGSTVTSMYADAGAVTWTIALSADTTNGGLAVTFTGQVGTTIRTVAQIRTTEMTY